jgi:NAD(P)-dependent dehydrogenase (short-subunit alcohol dehydrogenase family)
MKTMIITGAAGNLGTAVTETFLEKGCKVLAVTHSGHAQMASHERLFNTALDLQDEQAVKAFVDDAVARHKKIDGAILLAGGFEGGSLEETSLENIRKQVSLNFETAYTVCRHLLPHLKENHDGRLVLTASRPALEARYGTHAIAYALSKSMLATLAGLLNADAGKLNVVTSVIAPGTIDTPANRKSMPDADFSKWVSPQEIAELLYVICSGTGRSLREPVYKIYGAS